MGRRTTAERDLAGASLFHELDRGETVGNWDDFTCAAARAGCGAWIVIAFDHAPASITRCADGRALWPGNCAGTWLGGMPMNSISVCAGRLVLGAALCIAWGAPRAHAQ